MMDANVKRESICLRIELTRYLGRYLPTLIMYKIIDRYIYKMDIGFVVSRYT